MPSGPTSSTSENSLPSQAVPKQYEDVFGSKPYPSSFFPFCCHFQNESFGYFSLRSPSPSLPNKHSLSLCPTIRIITVSALKATDLRADMQEQVLKASEDDDDGRGEEEEASVRPLCKRVREQNERTGPSLSASISSFCRVPLFPRRRLHTHTSNPRMNGRRLFSGGATD